MFPDIKVKGTVVTVTFDLAGPTQESASGKTEVVASTRGNVSIPGTEFKLGLNAYRSKRAA